jgi:peptide/nickel transport system substrate-binding protein
MVAAAEKRHRARREPGRVTRAEEEVPMTRRARHAIVRLSAALAVAAAGLVPAALPAVAQSPVVLQVGTTQDLDATNPFNTELVVGYEAFQLTFNLLVEFDKDAHPAPGFADTWERADDRVTFHIRDGMTWSDGTPATSQDACFSWGLALAAIADESYIGSGYLDPGVKDAGVTKVECPDDTTFIAYTTDQSDRIFQVYMPMLPKHIYGELDYTKIAEEKFDGPLVGTGPYTLAEWKTGQFARFVRNESYWGSQGFADEVILRFFPDNQDTMVQALKAGELDYAHNVTSDQFKQLQADPAYTAIAGAANGWTQLAFNTYGTGTGKSIPDGGPSTKALLDTAFRDALGYAVDKDELVERVLGGFGQVGNTIVPPVLADWHVEPDKPRTFDLALADQKLTAAGYVKDAAGKRLDMEGKQITLSLVYPSTDEAYAKAAQFVQEWYGEIGIDVVSQSYDSDTLSALILPPPDGQAKYDIELWGWAGSPDPNALLQVFRCDQIGIGSDSQYCNPTYDALYDKQSAEAGDARRATLAQMQNLIYDEAVYDVLYYDANLDVYRNDRFAGWQNMPPDGTPLFTYGPLGYTLLTDATAAPSATPEAPSPSSSGVASPSAPGAPTASPSGSGSPTAAGGTSTPLLLLLVAGVAVVIVGGLIWSRRRAGASQEDE